MMLQVRTILSGFIIFSLIFPSTIFAASSAKPRSAVILPVVDGDGTIENQFAKELAYSLSHDLDAGVNVIDSGLLKQANKPTNTKALSSGYLAYYQKLSQGRNKYSLASDASGAVLALDALGTEILNDPDFNRELSRLYESVQLSKSWILFQSGQKDQATTTIQAIAEVKPDGAFDTVGYVSSFRKFIKETSKTKNEKTSALSFATKPKSVDVFIDGVFVGDSSQQIRVAPGKHNTFLAANGRRTIHKLVTATSGESKTIQASLSWIKGSKNNNRIVLPSDPFERLSLSTALNQGIHADKIVFLNVQKSGDGFQIAARVYDQNFHQPLATLQYPKVVRNIRSESERLHRYFVDKLKPHLFKPANHLWKGDYDDNLKLDDRIAMRPGKPIYRKPAFWAVVGTVVVGGVVLGMTLANGESSSGGGSGSVVVDVSGFSGVTR